MTDILFAVTDLLTAIADVLVAVADVVLAIADALVFAPRCFVKGTASKPALSAVERVLPEQREKRGFSP